MKKLFTLSAVAALALNVAAQADTETIYLLQLMEDKDNAESEHFEYDAQNRLIVQYLDKPGAYARTNYTYNDKNQVVREELYQDKTETGTNYQLRLYYTYEYDDQGRVIARDGFTSWEGNMTFTGGFAWEYDAAGHLVRMYDYTDAARRNVFQDVAYHYNALGQLETVEDKVLDIETQQYVPSSRTEYKYDALGRLTEIGTGKVAADNSYTLDRYEFYVYEDDGEDELDPEAALIEVYLTGASRRTKMSSKTYEYNKDIPASSVIYPINYQDEQITRATRYGMMKYQLVKSIDYRPDDNTGLLADVGTWAYEYDERSAGIEAVEAVRGLGGRFIPEVDGDVLTLTGLESVPTVKIYDLNGRLMQAASNPTGNTVSVATLDKGVYVVTTPSGAVKFVR